MSYFYILPLPESAGMMLGYVGEPARSIGVLKAAAAAVQLDLHLAEADSVDVQVTITDGTSPVTATIVAGQLSISTTVDATWAAAAALTMTVDTGQDGLSLSGNLWLQAVATGALSPGLVTLAEVKAAVGILSATAEQDAYLQRQIDAISARCRGYCGHHITTRQYRETWYRPTRAITSAPGITSIELATLDGNDLVVADELVADFAVGRVWYVVSDAPMDWTGRNQLVLEYTAGAADCPPDIKEPIFTAIGKRWEGFESSGQLVEEMGAVRKEVWQDSGSVEYAAGLGIAGPGGAGPDYVAGFPLAVLDDHRRIPLGYGEPTSVQVWEVL